MKKTSFIKTSLMAIAVATIALVSCDKKNNATTATNTSASTTGISATRIVYVNTDTLLTKYDYYKDVMKDIEAKSFRLDNELKNKSQQFQNKVALFQKQVQSGGLAQDVAQTRQAQLQQEQQEIVGFRDQQAQVLSKEQADKTDELLTKIQAYLKKYSKEGNFEMVIGYSKGGGVLYADDKLDITKTVLEGLNKEYAANKPVVAPKK